MCHIGFGVKAFVSLLKWERDYFPVADETRLEALRLIKWDTTVI